MWTKVSSFRTQWRNIRRIAKPPILTFIGVTVCMSSFANPVLSEDISLKFKMDKFYNVTLCGADDSEELDKSQQINPTASVAPTTDVNEALDGEAAAAVNWMTAAEMAKLVEEGRVVVAFQGNVYDITNFTGHPGGYGRLQMASGGDLAVFWSVYTQHNRGHIDYIMKRYKIGELDEEQATIVRENTKFQNPFLNDPQPYPDLLTNTRYPYNAEARLRDLRESWITPIGRHFVRNHSTVPDVDVDEYKLTVCGAGLNETTFTYDDLKNKFPKVDVTTVIQCNGNRREDFHYIDGETPAFGPPHWVAGAISNATWSGVRLRDVLRAAGMDVDSISLGRIEPPKEATSIGLLGMDTDEVGNQYCCSFPFEKAIDPFGDVILAYEMNGVPIPRPYGYPVRAIVPGNAGARNCKYLERVTVTNTPCCEHCNWKQYAVHAPDTPLEELEDFEIHKKHLIKDPAVQEMPVQSFITHPSAGDILGACGGDFTEVRVKGIAWGGGGDGINRVDVSIDGGKTFTRAELLPTPVKQRRGSHWSWVFFEQNIGIPESMREELRKGKVVDLELTSKALNTSWNVQPENPMPNKNPHGCCVNHWYRVPVQLEPNLACDVEHEPEGDFANKPSGGKFKKPFRNLDMPATAPPKINKCDSSGKKCVVSSTCSASPNSCSNDSETGASCSTAAACSTWGGGGGGGGDNTDITGSTKCSSSSSSSCCGDGASGGAGC